MITAVFLLRWHPRFLPSNFCSSNVPFYEPTAESRLQRPAVSPADFTFQAQDSTWIAANYCVVMRQRLKRVYQLD